MKIAIYHPNMHFMGGGETVSLTIAQALSKNNDVTIFVSKKPDIKKLEKFFNLNLKNIKFEVFGQKITKLPSFSSFKPSMYVESALKEFDNEKYELVIDTCSNGLFNKKISPKTICYIHFPNFTKQKKGALSVLNSKIIKQEDMFNYDEIICNSNFTEDTVKKLTIRKTNVIYPPVKTSEISPRRKKGKIITVGRYSPEKKLEVMIETFKELSKEFSSFTFEIVGAYRSETDSAYYNKLKKMSKGYNIVLSKNINHGDTLKKLEESSIYWHARGYGETNPTEYENFGITTVEAMAAGCLPIVINLGAQPEIITNSINGYTWETPDELISTTRKAIKQPSKAIISRAIKDSKQYDTKIFQKKINELTK